MPPEPSDAIKAALIQAAATIAVAMKMEERRLCREMGESSLPSLDEFQIQMIAQTTIAYELLAGQMDWAAWPPLSPVP